MILAVLFVRLREFLLSGLYLVLRGSYLCSVRALEDLAELLNFSSGFLFQRAITHPPSDFFPSVEILCSDWYGCTIYHFAQILEKSTKISTSSEKP